MAVKKHLATYSEYDQLVSAYPDRRFALLHGEIIEVSPSRPHSRIASFLHGQLFIFHQGYHVGELHIELRYKIPNDDHNAMIPDLSFIEDPTGLGEDTRPIPRMPDFAVEIKSPDNSYQEQRAKAAYYISNGSRLVWLVFPERRQIEVYRPDSPVEILGINGVLDGGDVLPGFTLPVSDVFPE